MTKRKSADESNKPARKKRQAFNAVKDRATKVKSEHNEKNSWLAKLPREIRRQIWRYVLGDEVLHINRWHDEDSLAVCNGRTLRQLFELSKGPEERIIPLPGQDWTYSEEVWNSLEGEDEKLQAKRLDRMAHFCHHFCLPRLDQDSSSLGEEEARKPHWGTNLNLLQTCRMVYHEANLVLWTTNTFSFDNSRRFSDFLRSRTSLQVQLLAKVHFILNHCDDCMPNWRDALSVATIKKLKGLREIHVYVEEQFLCHYLNSPSLMRYSRIWATTDIAKKDQTKRRTLEFFRIFRALPLQEATIIIDSANWKEESSDNLSHAKCVQWQEEIRNELLDPEATTKWQAEHDESAALWARQKAEYEEREKAGKARKTCSIATAEECARTRQERQDAKDTRDGRKRRKPFIAVDCGCQHPEDVKRGIMPSSYFRRSGIDSFKASNISTLRKLYF